MAKRILYVMHVDWGWIKQRPHFIAQHLAISNTVLILYPFSRKRFSLSGNSRTGLTVVPFLRLPFARKLISLHYVNRFVLKVFFWGIIKWFRPDVIWLTFPDLHDYLPAGHNVATVYDCMDDALAFDANENRRTLLLKLEKTLVLEASHVFCSSQHLQTRLDSRAPCKNKSTLLYNAYEPEFLPTEDRPLPVVLAAGQFGLGYIGTISPWLDFDGLNKALKRFPNLQIHLIGPVDDLSVDGTRENIHIHGPVEHSELHSWARCFDALVMPFKVTELVKSVDPVKLYEYIFFNKPILSVYYPGLERFSNFVTFYSTHEELLEVISAYINTKGSNKYSEQERLSFLEKNTWSSRTVEINRVLDTLNA